MWWLSPTDLDNLLMHFHFFLACVITNLSTRYWVMWCFRIEIPHNFEICGSCFHRMSNKSKESRVADFAKNVLNSCTPCSALPTYIELVSLWKKVLWGYRNDFICFEVLEKMHYVVKSLLWDYLCSFPRDRIFAGPKGGPRRKVMEWDGQLFDAFITENPISKLEFCVSRQKL